VCRPPIEVRFKAKLYLSSKTFQNMWHPTCMQRSQGDSRFLMVKSQIDNLTPDPSFAHNLCFNHPNGSCEPISDIYVPRAFQWYNQLHNLMGFDPRNCFLKIQRSIMTPSLKVKAHLGVWRLNPSHFPTHLGAWDVTFRLPLLAHTLASPYFGREPKARVVTLCVLLCEKEIKEHENKLYLSICNVKWLKVVWILTFFLNVCST
jgi:hypothetical protein